MTKKVSYQKLEEIIDKLKKELSEKQAFSQKTAINEKRLKSLWKIASMQDSDFNEICDTVLEEIVNMTESQYGFYGFIENNEKDMTLYSWSKTVMADCSVHSKTLHFEIEKSGIWGNAVRERGPVIYNNYALKLDNKKGTPDGHIPIEKILSVPIFSLEGKILALGCVANKQENYDNDDASQLSTYLSNVQLILENRKTEEERKLLFAKAIAEIKTLRGILPICSYCKKIRNDKGAWDIIEAYICTHSDAEFSHGVCPECYEKHRDD